MGRRLKTIWRCFDKYGTALLPTIFYYIDGILDTYSTYEFCTDGQEWWCVLSCLFLILPELFISLVIAVKIWQNRNKKEVTNCMVILVIVIGPTMLLPYLLLPVLSYNTWKGENTAEDSRSISISRITTLTLIQLKGMEAILQSCPQISLKSYIVIHKQHCIQGFVNGTSSMNVTTGEDHFQNYEKFCNDMWSLDESARVIGPLEVISPLVSLVTLSFSIARLVEHVDWYKTTVWFCVLLGSLGSRLIVCGVFASWHQALWIVPPIVASSIVPAIKKLRYCRKDEPYPVTQALKDVLEKGLLMSYPSTEGIVASVSYIGFAVVFYVRGIIVTDVATEELGKQALIICIVCQGLSLLVAFLARSIGYKPPELPINSILSFWDNPDDQVQENPAQDTGNSQQVTQESVQGQDNQVMNEV